MNGTVYLVGAGPGDPELLTLKARRLLGAADAVVYDYLVAPEILALARAHAELVFVGKKGGGFCCPQRDIDDTLIRLARQGKNVIRLKGGDPFIFGRGGEEAEALVAGGIAFEIVPGVTSALAAAAYAGIPLTHRSHSSAVVFLTGHEDPNKPDAAIHYAKLCREAGILTSLDGGGLRANTHELLQYIDVAIVAERLCEQMNKTPEAMLDYLKERGCRVGGVTQGEKGLLWYDETGTVHALPALKLARERVIDTNGAGDVFHGAYVYSYLSNPEKSWHEHFVFARAASTFKIQRLGNEAGLPTLPDIAAVRAEFEAA